MIGGVDLAIVVISLLGLLAVAGWIARRQHSAEDYYLGGRALPAWALGCSLAANQVSAISLIGAPAFVARREGGGLVWLQYELAVPLALALLAVWGVPVLRQAGGADVYGAVERRLGRSSRRVLAIFFLLGRGLGAGVVLYSSALVVDALTGWGLNACLAVVAVVAIAYTTLGGLVADVVSDVLQLGLLWGGTLLATGLLALHLQSRGRLLQGDGALLTGVDPARLVPLDFGGHGLGDGAVFSFWPMLFGGLFLYLSYYGCDQTQAQRILAAPTAQDACRALTWAALIRFPLVLTYCAFGVLLAALLVAEPGFAARLEGLPPDALVPEFLATYAPVGVLGVAVAGILAAALSSIDSALNSLSAVTLEEVMPSRIEPTSPSAVRVARAGTVAWGIWAALTGWWFSGAGETVIELVNRVGSVVYGPILAVFLLAAFSQRADDRSAAAGAMAGVACNVAAGAFLPGLSWLWWNVLGCAVTWAVGTLLGTEGARLSEPTADDTLDEAIKGAPAHTRVLLVEFGLILAALGALTWWLAARGGAP